MMQPCMASLQGKTGILLHHHGAGQLAGMMLADDEYPNSRDDVAQVHVRHAGGS